MNYQLLEPFQLNHLFTLKNRIVMAPMTRVRATDESVPTQEMADYYARRSAAGLIVTEGTVIQADALGQWNVPGIYNDEQIEHWRVVTDQVHDNNGLIFSQLWHVGRVSHPDFLGGKLPISPSETVMTGRIARGKGLMLGKSRAASVSEIHQIVEQYASAAANAIRAGFDGVEIHGANGYLIDQFLHYHTNLRTDEYGGSAENMSRFPLEVVRAIGEAIGFERVGLRLSPGGYLNEIVGDMRDAAVFEYLIDALNQLPLAYLHTGNFNDAQVFPELHQQNMTAFLRSCYKGKLIACGSYSFAQAQEGVDKHQFDLVALGRPFIANPDLIELLRTGQTLKPYDVSMLNTLY